MRWALTGPLASLDVESTSVDVEDARVVDIALALIVPGRDLDMRTCVVDPGVEIPAEATAVHGITTERARSEGKPAVEVLDVYVADVADALKAGIPLVAQNAVYDLTVLDRECRRHRLPTLSDRLGGPICPVVDPMVIDKRCIGRRRRVSPTQGPRCLKTLAQVYGVPWDDEQAHGAAYDALITARVVWRIAQWCCRTPAELAATKVGPFNPPTPLHRNDVSAFIALARMTPQVLHTSQVRWYAHQADSFRTFLNGLANQRREEAANAANGSEQQATALQDAAEIEAKADGVGTEWPVVAYVEPAAAAQEVMPV